MAPTAADHYDLVVLGAGPGGMSLMPRVTFCQPQVAGFGYTDEQARAAGYRVRIATFPITPRSSATTWRWMSTASPNCAAASA